MLRRAGERLLRLAERIGQAQPLLGVGAVVLAAPQPVALRRERTRALRDTGAERGRLGPQVGVGQILEPRFVAVDRVDQRLDPLELALEARVDELGDELFEHQSSNDTTRARRYSRAPRRGPDTGPTGRAAHAPAASSPRSPRSAPRARARSAGGAGRARRGARTRRARRAGEVPRPRASSRAPPPRPPPGVT